MTVRWSARAVNHLEGILGFIAKDRPAVAVEVVERLITYAEGFDRQPFAGRAGSKPGTRERLLPGLPFVIVYRVVGASDVEILGVYHGARIHRD